MGPWAVVGDFNCILNASEKKGGSPTYRSRDMAKFKETVQQCNLIDAGFRGYQFTWRRGQIEVRLDRALINLDWRLRFLEAVVHHLPHFKSDHQPLFIKFNRDKRRPVGRRPFRFEATWLSHTQFKRFLGRCWKSNRLPWSIKVRGLQRSLREWNKRTFGDINSKKQASIKRIEDLDSKMALTNNNLLVQEQVKVWREYEEVLAQEEIMWFQKSRSKWLQFGDRNTKFYHAVTTIRRRRNIYESLQNDQGEWVDHPEHLARMATNYFKNLFLEDYNCVEFGLHGAFPTIQEEEKNDLERPITNLEILQTINRMGGLKAPGPEGFQAIFYQTPWDIIGGDLSSLIKGIFENPERVADLNETLISLIPKMELVTCMKHFRPISLCNVSYKIVTKIIAQRLRGLMPHLIGSCQSSFVPNRKQG